MRASTGSFGELLASLTTVKWPKALGQASQGDDAI